MYSQITLAERYTLGILRQLGYCPAVIARVVGRHRSTIGRELCRNSRPDGRLPPGRGPWAGAAAPLALPLAQTLAGGQPVAGVTPQAVNEMNAGHAKEHDAVTKDAALDLLQRNSAAAAAAVRALSDGQLDQAAPVSLYSDARLTCHFMLEDHAVRHSYHHLAGIRRALGRTAVAA